MTISTCLVSGSPRPVGGQSLISQGASDAHFPDEFRWIAKSLNQPLATSGQFLLVPGESRQLPANGLVAQASTHRFELLFSN